MQLAIQDVRGLGFQKICNSFYKTEQGKTAFFERLILINNRLSGVNSSAFSLPRYYKELYGSLELKYSGMVRFMNMCEPMILEIDKPDIVLQRKVRNQWDSLWKGLKRDLDLSDDLITSLKELGIRIAFDKDNEVSDEIYNFYSSILNWYVLTQSESTIQEKNLNSMKLVSVMVLSDSDSFLDKVCCETY
jgi:hypothetical protein